MNNIDVITPRHYFFTKTGSSFSDYSLSASVMTFIKAEILSICRSIWVHVKDHREGAVAVISLGRLRRQYLQKAHHSECERLFNHGKQLTFMTCQLSQQTVPKLSPCSEKLHIAGTESTMNSFVYKILCCDLKRAEHN